MRQSTVRTTACLFIFGFLRASVAPGVTIHDCASGDGLNLEGAAEIAAEGPAGENVLRIDGQFSGRIDLKALGIDPKQYDLLKFEAKTPRGAFLRFSLENYPKDGELSHWYVFDGTRGPSDWKTVWIDLRLIEEVKLPGKYKGMAAKDSSLRGLQFMGNITDSRRSIQEPGMTMWVRNIRAVKKAIDLDWDQRQFSYTWEKGEDLVYTYPLTVKNLLDRPATVKLSLVPFDAQEARAGLSVGSVALEPGESRAVMARVWLPAAAAAAAAPLRCERFQALAAAEGLADSDVTILRSADPIHLNVTVPIPEERLTLPFYPRLKDLPEYVFGGYDEKLARERAAQLTPETVREVVEESVRNFGVESGGVLNTGIGSAAFLWAFTGEQQYFEKLRSVFKAYAEVYSRLWNEERQQEYRLVSDGVMAGNILQFCFKFGGAQRPPYFYSTNGNGKGGSLFGHMHAFDAIAADLPDDERRFIIEHLFVPAIIQARNHYFGLGNQQCNSDNVMLYGALLARHWPIAGFAYGAEHGLPANIKWTFDDDGLCREGHYQEYTINPILHATELLWGRGIDLYDQRLYEILHSKGAAAIGMDYRYAFARFLDEQRFAGKPFVAELAAHETDGYHLTASTLLKWNDLEVAMNWGTHIFRGSHDRCALTVRRRAGPGKTRTVCGGGSYNHSSFGQSIVIIDENLQHSVPGPVTGYDVEGPVQFVQCRSDEHYPGSTITRTFALLGSHVLIVDRIVNDRPRTVDWFLLNAGGKTSLALEKVEQPLTAKPDDNRVGVTFGAGVGSFERAATDDAWTAMNGTLYMLGAPGTEVRVFRNNQSALIARRTAVNATDFVACLSPELTKVESVPVTRADGKPADAAGVKVVLADGTTFHALVNYEAPGVEVRIGDLQTDGHFASDYPEK